MERSKIVFRNFTKPQWYEGQPEGELCATAVPLRDFSNNTKCLPQLRLLLFGISIFTLMTSRANCLHLRACSDFFFLKINIL
jgi:hypothetical protein